MRATPSSFAPGESALLCAVCGPISDEDLRGAGIALRDEPGVISGRRLHAAQQQPPWTQLRQLYAEHEAVRRAARRIEILRARSGASGQAEASLLTARARQALLEDRQDDFDRLLAAYLHLHPFRSAPLHEAEFWASVLGPGLEGSRWIAHRPARDHAAAHIALNFAFSALPAESADLSDGSADIGPELGVAFALRSGARDRLRRLAAEEPGSPAEAALHLLEGRTESARRLFSLLLPLERDEDPLLDARLLPLRVYAVIAALGAGASASLCRELLGYAYRQLDRCLDLAQRGARDYISLLDNLDWLLNSLHHPSRQLPRARGPISLIPMLWGYACLPAEVRRGIPVDSVAAQLQTLADERQSLMAAWGAAALRDLLPPEDARQASLRQLCLPLGDCPALHPLRSSPAAPAVDLSPELLSLTPGQQLYWDVQLSPEGKSIRRVSLSLSRDAGAIGLRPALTPQNLGTLSALMDADDRRCLPLLQDLCLSDGRDLQRVSLLSGHPRLRLEHAPTGGTGDAEESDDTLNDDIVCGTGCMIGDSLRDGITNGGRSRGKAHASPQLEPACMQSRLPRLELRYSRSGVELRPEMQSNPAALLEPADPAKNADGGDSLKLLRSSELQRRFCDRLLSESPEARSLRLEQPDPLELQALLNELSEAFELRGQLLPPGMARQASAPELVVDADYHDGQLRLRAGTLLLPDARESTRPGRGSRLMALDTAHGVVGVSRRLAEEQKQLRDLLTRCPALMTPPDADADGDSLPGTPMLGTSLLGTPLPGNVMPGAATRGTSGAVAEAASAPSASAEAEAPAAARPARKGREPLPDQFGPWTSSQRQAEVLRQLREAGVRLRWVGSEALRLAEADDLHLDARSSGVDWLSIGGELHVNEQLVIQLSRLLEVADSPRVALKDGSRLLLSPELLRTLRCLRRVLRRDGESLVSRAAVPALCELLPGSADALRRALSRGSAGADVSAAPPPEGLRATLRPYQLEGYRWLLERAELGIGACLADDMGLGKTIQSLALLLARASGGPALIVAPLTLLGNWAAEAARFAPSLQVHLLRSGSRAEGGRRSRSGTETPPGAGSITLASYGQIAARPELAQQHWHTLILDEAQNIRNPGTRRSKSIFNLEAAARIGLSGTPVENGTRDLWSLMHFLNPGLLGSESDFRRRFDGEEQLDTLRRLTAPLILRRSRDQVLPQLPPLTDITLPITLSDEERALYEGCRRRALEQCGQRRGQLFAELTRLRRLCCHGSLVAPGYRGPASKFDALSELVVNLHRAGRRVLIFSQFTDVLDLASRRLDELGLTRLQLDGRSSAPQRDAVVQSFQRGEADALLLSLTAGGTGLNLTAASDVILLDPWWNPSTEQQAAARAHRPGQHHPVTLYRLCAQDTVEERILALQEHKKKLAQQLIGEGNIPLRELLRLLSD